MLEWRDTFEGSIREATVYLKPYHVVAYLTIFKEESGYMPRVTTCQCLLDLPVERSWEAAQKAAIASAIDILTQALEVLKENS